MRSILISISCVFVTLSIPAFYVGAKLALHFDLFPIVALPTFLCVAISGAAMHFAESTR